MSRRSLGLVAICGGVFLAFLDTTIVNTSFPAIRAGFGDASPAELSLDSRRVTSSFSPRCSCRPAGWPTGWGASAYFSPVPWVFLFTSVLCAVAPDAGSCSWQRGSLQGVGAAMMVPVSLALLLPLFPPERRAAGVGIWGAAAALAATRRPAAGRAHRGGGRLALDLPREPAARRGW